MRNDAMEVKSKTTPCGHADRVRSMINHENELINHRIQWFLIIQGFLFATVGVALNIQFSINKGLYIPVVSLVGALSSVSSFYSLEAANKAILKLEKEFKLRYLNYNGPPVIGLSLLDWRGKIFRPSLFLPILFIYSWVVIAWISILA